MGRRNLSERAKIRLNALKNDSSYTAETTLNSRKGKKENNAGD
jgi:hypothetical protein